MNWYSKGGRKVFDALVQERQAVLGCSREQAEMLVAALCGGKMDESIKVLIARADAEGCCG